MMYEDIPAVCTNALQDGYDGRVIRRLAALMKPISRELSDQEVDPAFREIGSIAAPLYKTDVKLSLAIATARAALSGGRNVFDTATHIRIYIRNSGPKPEALSDTVRLAKESEHAPRHKWTELEQEIRRSLEALANHPDPVQGIELNRP